MISNIKLLLPLVVLLLTSSLIDATIKISGRTMYVDGTPYFAKGVNYGVVPVGQTIGTKDGKSWDWQSTPGIYNRDLPLIQEMGVNTLRTYGWRNNINHDAFLSACLSRGIRVTIGWRFDLTLFATAEGRQKMKTDLVNLVKNHAKHPAVLMWAIGNELNAGGRGYQPSVWNFIGELKDLVHSTEAAMGTWHPVGSPVADGSTVFDIIKGSNSKVDVWMVQLYKGKSFYDFFTRYAAASTKPLIVTEFGVDSYNGAGVDSGELAQNDYLTALWKELLSNTKVVSGGFVFSFIDSWAKCSGLSPAKQELCSKAAGTRFPGGYVNEEYFGMVAISNTQPRADYVDTVRRKSAFSKMKSLYASTVAISRLEEENTELIPYEGQEDEEPISVSPEYDGEQEIDVGTRNNIILGVVVPGGSIIGIAAVVGLFFFLRRRNSHKSSSEENKGDEIELKVSPSRAELLTATPSMSELVPTRTDSDNLSNVNV